MMIMIIYMLEMEEQGDEVQSQKKPYQTLGPLPNLHINYRCTTRYNVHEIPKDPSSKIICYDTYDI